MRSLSAHQCSISQPNSRCKMDLVYGKCVQTGALGFVIGGGFHLWQNLDALIRGQKFVSSADLPFESKALAASASQQLAAQPVVTGRMVLREALGEGLRTSKILAAATAAGGTASFIQHGRYSERMFRLRGDPLSTASAVFAAVMFYLPSQQPRLQRVGSSLIIACVCGVMSGSMGP